MVACRHCSGGLIPVGEQFVTGPTVDGQSTETIWSTCPCCGGHNWANCPACTAEIKEALETLARAVRIFNISRNITPNEVEKANKAMECIRDVLKRQNNESRGDYIVI